uniref:NADH dehydrogenase subunit 3 n=1 Tax=Parascaris univalens TaxID=6257 RepID=A0A915CHD6_PARUN
MLQVFLKKRANSLNLMSIFTLKAYCICKCAFSTYNNFRWIVTLKWHLKKKYPNYLLVNILLSIATILTKENNRCVGKKSCITK